MYDASGRRPPGMVPGYSGQQSSGQFAPGQFNQNNNRYPMQPNQQARSGMPMGQSYGQQQVSSKSQNVVLQINLVEIWFHDLLIFAALQVIA